MPDGQSRVLKMQIFAWYNFKESIKIATQSFSQGPIMQSKNFQTSPSRDVTLKVEAQKCRFLKN